MAFLKHLLPAWKRGIEDKQKANAAILAAFDKELTVAEQEGLETKLLMSLDTASGEWLDSYGKLFGVIRRDSESDIKYRKRIVGYILLKRGTIPAITDAIREFLEDYDTHIEIYEPYKNIFYLNRSKLNGPDHMLGEYYTFAVIDIRLARTFPVGIIDLINEFKPAGVSVRLTYRPNAFGKGVEVVELPLASSEVLKTNTQLTIMNGMNDRIRGHLNLTGRSRGDGDDSGLFVLNSSRLNSTDRLAGSFSAANSTYNLASFTTQDVKFPTTAALTDVTAVTQGMSSDFYTRTGQVSDQYAAQRLKGTETSYLHSTFDVYTYFDLNYGPYLRERQPNGLYTKADYLALMENPSLQFFVKAETAVTNPSRYTLQLLNFRTNAWENIKVGDVSYSITGGKVSIVSLADFLSDKGFIFSRIKVNPNAAVPEYDFHVHFIELGFKKEVAVRPTVPSLFSEVSSQVTLVPL